MGLFKILKYQLYLLQMENYELGRYFSLLWKKGLWGSRQPQRKSLVWTQKSRALMVMAAGLHLIAILVVVKLVDLSLFLPMKWGEDVLGLVLVIVSVLVGCYIYFIFFTIALWLLWPVDAITKAVIVARAKRKIEGFNGGKGSDGNKGGLTIIGIAGSYGKTTMKDVLAAVLSSKFKIAATPESVNTPVGIARWILKKIDTFTDIVILEMGEHYEGDIKEICDIAQPDIAVVTGINEAHLERMKKMDTVVSTIFEIVSHAKPGAMVVLNGDDKNVAGHYKEYAWPDHKLAVYGQRNYELGIKNYEFSTEKLGWEIEIDGTGKVFINLLGEYALGDVDVAIKIAKELGMNNQEIIEGIKNIKPVEHRLQPIKSVGNILVIDDSYNGNPAGATEAIKVLSRFSDRREIYITPGLVEMGKAAKEVHLQIGQQLAGAVDVVILIRNSVTPFIAEAINGSTKNQISRTKPEIIWYNTAQEAHSSLGQILKPGDVVLFQNDWGDQYI